MMDIDPEILKAILQGGADSGQLDPEIENLKQMSEQIRGMRPNMGLMDAGAFKVAPGWGNAIANMGMTYADKMNMQKRKTLEQQQADIRSGQNQRVIDALLKQRAGPQAGGYQGGTPPIVPMQNDPFQRFKVDLGGTY